MPDTIAILETDRLILRKIPISDGDAFQAAVNHREVIDNQDGVDYPVSLDDANEHLLKIHEAANSGHVIHLGIYPKETRELIGAIYFCNINPLHKSAELGYWLSPQYHRIGYATEAAKHMVDYGFTELDLNRIWGMCFTRNPASAKVLENVGMVREGKFRQEILKNGIFEDLYHYSILKSDWEKFRRGENIIQLETDRLIFRPLTRDDAPSIRETFDHREYREFTVTVDLPYTLENAKAFIRKANNLWRENKAFFFAIIEKESGELIGEAHIHWIEWEQKLCEFGMGLHPGYWSKGYAREAASEMMRFAFEDLNMHRIYAMTMAVNKRSRKLVENLGWEFEGIGHEEWKQRDTHVDFAHYSILKKDWDKIRIHS